jgi:exodeoxyribonuclease V gamma subunit
LPGLKLFTSNRLEILADKLAELLSEPLASPFDAEVIVVQSRGMEQWVSMQLAHRRGICANLRFPFPNAFVQDVFRRVLSDLPERSPFDPEIITWRIMKLLPSCITRPGFEGLGAYLKDDADRLKRLQLSERISDTIDQYLLFRPQMIFEWEKGKENHWQAQLFRELVKECGKGHRAELGKELIKAIRGFPSRLKGLPERVSVFGISALPRFHIQIFSAISRVTEVNLFLMNPCREYWGDIVSEWEMKRKVFVRDGKDLTLEELHLEKGNSLLGSMGALGRDFFDLVNETHVEEFACFQDHKKDGLLSFVKSDILNLRDAEQRSDNKKIIHENDASIQVHSCHSPMREMEVLNDRLLDMFEKDPDLSPEDVLVMTPDIEAYTPYVRAVFDVPADDKRKIPFSIADRSVRRESEIIDTFLSILDLSGSRFGASQVMAILESPAVRLRFGIEEAHLDLIQRWVLDTRIRWGIDGRSRVDMGLPGFSENTWRAGLARLLLGYAMPSRDENMFGGILPYDYLEGGDALVLGRFTEFTELLITHVTSLGRSRTLSEWSQTLRELLEDFFIPNETTEREMQVIRGALGDLAGIKEITAFDEKIDINVIKWHLGHCLEREVFGSGFITGGITFCAMLPMRSIPFKVICLVGMNNDAYPKQSKPLSFDLMAQKPQKGDRSRRDDDRYLFLEVILSTRKTLYVSHVGQSIRDNSHIPPSVLVSELLDYIEQGFEIPGKGILSSIVTKHRLQPFSPEYFKKNEKLFSYSKENLRAAQSMTGGRREQEPFISGGLSEPAPEEWKTVDLDDLCSFFGNPVKFLLERRLLIYLREKASIPEEREAFDIKGLEKYLLEEHLMKSRLQGRNLKDLLPSTRAGGLLPHGTVGECTYEELSRGVEGFAEKIAPHMQEKTLEPLDVELHIAGFRITGRIRSVYPERLVQYRYAGVKPKDRLKVWLYHLALNTIEADHYPCNSMLAGLMPKGNDSEWVAWEYPAMENSEAILESLLELYRAGLVMPIHFFPGSSWEYARMLLEKNKDEEDALGKALKIWQGGDYKRGECEDPYYQLCFGNINPLDSEFKVIAEEVFGPLLQHQEEIKA